MSKGFFKIYVIIRKNSLKNKRTEGTRPLFDFLKYYLSTSSMT